jgi:hypothetical protein
LKRGLVIILFLGILSQTAFLQVSDRFIMKLDTNNLLIGEQASLELIAVVPKNSQFVWPLLSDTIGPLEIVKASKLDTIDTLNMWLLGQAIIITSFDSGYFKIPNQAIAINKGEWMDSVYSNSLAIIYNTIELDSTKRFYDIKRPMRVKYYYVKEILLGLLALLILAGVIYYFYQRKGATSEVFIKPEKQISPDKKALIALNRLKREKAWSEWGQKEYYVELTFIIREYLEGRFSINAIESTTDEIIDQLKNTDIPINLREELLRLFINGDMVKFAKGKPSEKDAENGLELAYQFIEDTRIKQETEDNV